MEEDTIVEGTKKISDFLARRLAARKAYYLKPKKERARRWSCLPEDKLLAEDANGLCAAFQGPFAINGYARFCKDELPPEWSPENETSREAYDHPALLGLDIHGGITYSDMDYAPDGDFIVFGFDCAHYRDEENEMLRDPRHVLGLAQEMRSEILAASARFGNTHERG